jgi:HSP20 family protein
VPGLRADLAENHCPWTTPPSGFDTPASDLTFAEPKEENDMALMTSRWEPFREIARLQDEMSRVLDNRYSFNGTESVGWTPAVDIYEDEDAVTLRAELPGVEPKDVDVRFENGVLTLRGERKLEQEEKRENYHRVERSYGTFTRSFALPGTVDAEKIRAEAKNGILSIVLPKRSEAKPRAIQVKVS